MIFLGCQTKCLYFFRRSISCRMFCSVTQDLNAFKFRYRIRPRKSAYAKVLQDVFECSNESAYDVLNKYPDLNDLDVKRIQEAGRVLKGLQVKGEEIRACPRVLSILPITIEHHLRVLLESGFTKVSPKSVLIYKLLVKKKISLLKTHGLLPMDANVSKNFLTTLEAPENVFQSVENIIDVHSGDNTINILRDTVLKCYLQWRLNATQEEVEHIFSTYTRVNHKSLELIRRTVTYLLNELHFSEDQITRCGYLIQTHPDHLKKIVENVPYLAGKPIQDVLSSRPSMAVANYENFIEILRVLKSAGFTEEEIVQNPYIFYLTGQCVRERLPSLDPNNMSPELKAFMDDEKFLKILLHYKNFNHRAAYLSEQTQNSFVPIARSLNIFVGPQKNFERFVKGLSGPTIGREVVTYLTNTLTELADKDLNVTKLCIRESLKKNPNWRSVALSEVKECFEMLCRKGYKPKEILLSLPVVLYPSHQVKNHLENLSRKPEVLECFQLNDILGNDFLVGNHSKSSDVEVSKQKGPHLIRKYALPLCLYFLEQNHHFTGDGIWFRK